MFPEETHVMWSAVTSDQNFENTNYMLCDQQSYDFEYKLYENAYVIRKISVYDKLIKGAITIQNSDLVMLFLSTYYIVYTNYEYKYK